MLAELHLFIIWSKAKYKEKMIIDDINRRFEIIGIHKISWKRSKFSTNLTRLYGESIPPDSNKEKHCGNDAFTLVVVIDRSPLYRIRKTSKGALLVNVNMFDSKEMYRHWTGGGHKIHGTNDEKELQHDLVLLTGCSKADYLRRYKEKGGRLNESFNAMPGEDAWRDMAQVLYVLNETIDYVVLRNFRDLFSDYSNSVHGDVDILTSNKYLAKIVLNAKPVYKSSKRVQHVVKIGDDETYFDIRYIGDNYYCKEWEKEIISSRYLTKDGYYRTSEENYIYSLLYHALVQKKDITADYMEIISEFFGSCDIKVLTNELILFLHEHHYDMFEPHDYSVYFSKRISGKNMSLKKIINKAFYRLIEG